MHNNIAIVNAFSISVHGPSECITNNVKMANKRHVGVPACGLGIVGDDL